MGNGGMCFECLYIIFYQGRKEGKKGDNFMMRERELDWSLGGGV